MKVITPPRVYDIIGLTEVEFTVIKQSLLHVARLSNLSWHFRDKCGEVASQLEEGTKYVEPKN